MRKYREVHNVLKYKDAQDTIKLLQEYQDAFIQDYQKLHAKKQKIDKRR